jgi:DNA-directed RNA polymerase I and III subunit RPAC1
VRKCTTCRECIRPEKFKERIELGKLKDRFEFHVESVGMYKPQDIVIEALRILKEKAHFWLDVLEQDHEADDEDLGGASATASKK